MQHKKRIGYLISAALLAAVLAGCSQSPFGIFASVARERAILDDRNLDNEITVGAMTKAGTKYFLAAGALYYRDEDNPGAADDADKKPSWESVPAPGTNYTTTSVVTVDFTGTDERVFAVYASADGVTHRVYEIDVADPKKTPTPRFETTGSDFALGEIFALDDGLDVWLVVNHEGDATISDWSLYGSTDGDTFSPISGTAANEPYVDVVADPVSNDVLYLRANAVLTDVDGVAAGADPGDAAPAPGLDSPARFTGAHYDSVGNLFWLADNSGHLYSAAPGFAAWTRNTTAYTTSSADNAPVISFTDFSAVPRGAQTVLLVGTSGYGYRVIGDAATATATSGVSSPAVDGSNYESSALATSTVSAWFVDPDPVTGYPVVTADGEQSWDGSIVFAGTPKQGLWRALSSDDGPIQWLRE
ncbi:MAG TPA: hypothetical protein VKA06_08480 [Spirochaetia bacterium]|nr:hypothetical protein [Spirochaetia bacterium]